MARLEGKRTIVTGAASGIARRASNIAPVSNKNSPDNIRNIVVIHATRPGVSINVPLRAR